MNTKMLVLASLAIMCGCAVNRVEVPITLSETTGRDDGSPISWRLTQVTTDDPKPVLLIAQGSGCAPARSNSNVDLLAAKLPEFAALTIEKYGVNPGVAPVDSMNDCSDEYYANHTVTRRVEDAKLVLEELRARSLWDGRLVVFGGSEGGAVVSILARESKDVDAVVVFSTGTGLTMAEFFPMVVPPPVAQHMAAVFDEVRSNPLSLGIAGGNSMKWWADILDRRLSDDLLDSSAPILLIHGENDSHAPVSAARATRDAFVSAGKADRLAYWELAHRDHQMRDKSGNPHIEEVFDEVAKWVRSQKLCSYPLKALENRCPTRRCSRSPRERGAG